MDETGSLCILCAWRKDCQKRLRFESSSSRKCPDYTRDVTIKEKDNKDK